MLYCEEAAVAAGIREGRPSARRRNKGRGDMKKTKSAKSGSLQSMVTVVKAPKAEKTPYMSRGVYNNYAKGMKEKNQKRAKMRLEVLYIRTFEEWSTQ
jgi:hypothetical protein